LHVGESLLARDSLMMLLKSKIAREETLGAVACGVKLGSFSGPVHAAKHDVALHALLLQIC